MTTNDETMNSTNENRITYTAADVADIAQDVTTSDTLDRDFADVDSYLAQREELEAADAVASEVLDLLFGVADQTMAADLTLQLMTSEIAEIGTVDALTTQARLLGKVKDAREAIRSAFDSIQRMRLISGDVFIGQPGATERVEAFESDLARRKSLIKEKWARAMQTLMGLTQTPSGVIADQRTQIVALTDENKRLRGDGTKHDAEG